MSVAKTKFKPSEISSIVEHIINNNKFLVEQDLQPLAVEVEGDPGIGKTTLLIDKAKKMGLDYYKLSMSQTDELSDLLGFPIRELKTKSGEWINEKQCLDPSILTGETRTTHCPPKWVPTDENSVGLLILDDWTRADSRFATAAMELIEKSEYMSWKLPKGWTIVLTSNPDSGDYNVTSLDSAQKTRFLSLSMKYDMNDWALWAESNKIDSRCINFILLNPEMINDTNKNLNARVVTKFFNSISSITNFQKNIELIRALGEASVGPDFSQAFIIFINNEQDKIPSPYTILNNDNEEYVIGELKRIIGSKEINTYKPAIAGTISSRLINYITYAVNSSGVFHKKEFISRIKRIILEDILHEDCHYHIVGSLTKIKQFESLMQDKELKRFIK